MTYHASQSMLLCHHCESKQQLWKSCPDCGNEKLLLLGHGTEKIEQELIQRFGKSVVLRIDRDTTKRRGAIQSKLQSVHRGKYRLTLVGILNVDQGLYSGDFRAMEHLAQLIVQVSGRAGRSQRQGKVMLQTHQPDHPLLNLLIEGGYEAFAERSLQERSTAGLPPVSRMLVLRAETPKANLAMDFLSQAKQSIPDNCNQSIDVIGPMPAPMERRSGKYRAQLIMLAKQRKLLSQVLRNWVPRLIKLRSSSRVRWSVDVDPMDMT